MSWFSRFLPTCHDMSRLISQSMDQSLPLSHRMRMCIHLWICGLCRRYQQQLALLRTVLRKGDWRLSEGNRPSQPGLPPDAKARIRQALDSHRH